jgi:ElaB/YqjD/DUF883 family membrane-anchored ribosome-binding protein
MNDADRLAQAAAEGVSDKAGEAREKFREVAERVRETCDELKEIGLVRARQADEVVRENPYQSIGVAFAAGLLLGWLVGRK